MSICPLQSKNNGRREQDCQEGCCAWWNDKARECMIVSCMKKYLNPIGAIIEPNPNFTPPAIRVRSDIH